MTEYGFLEYYVSVCFFKETSDLYYTSVRYCQLKSDVGVQYNETICQITKNSTKCTHNKNSTEMWSADRQAARAAADVLTSYSKHGTHVVTLVDL